MIPFHDMFRRLQRRRPVRTRSGAHHRSRPTVELLEDYLLLSGIPPLTPLESSNPVIWVTSTADDGPGTLREALLQADSRAGLDSIRFNIQPQNGQEPGLTIHLVHALPLVLDQVDIDGSTAGGRVQIDGSNVASLDTTPLEYQEYQYDGLVFYHNVGGPPYTSDGSRVSGLVISGFQNDGIRVRAEGITIENCYIGTTADGMAAQGNGGMGIHVETSHNVICNNVISSNVHSGVYVNGWYRAVNNIGTKDATDNEIYNNFIGTTADGLAALGNGWTGSHWATTPRGTSWGPATSSRATGSASTSRATPGTMRSLATPSVPTGTGPRAGQLRRRSPGQDMAKHNPR